MHETRLSLVAPSRDLETLIEKTKAYIRGAKAPATLLAYKSDFRDFTRFCREHNLSFLPSTPETVALYITDCASRLASGTITRRLTSITKAHQSAGSKDSPASTHHFIVSETLKGIRRAIGTAQHGKKPLLTADIRRIIASCPKSLRGRRDCALLLIGFAGAFRRSELAAIEVSDVSYSKDGLVIDLRRSKTDQQARGRQVGIPFGGDAGDMSGPRGAPLAEGIANQVRSPVPRDQPSRPHQSARFESRLDRLDSEASGAEGGNEDPAIGRSLASRGLRHTGGDEWSERTRHHAPDRAQVGGDFGQVHPHRADVHSQCGGEPRDLGSPACQPALLTQDKENRADLREKGLLASQK